MTGMAEFPTTAPVTLTLDMDAFVQHLMNREFDPFDAALEQLIEALRKDIAKEVVAAAQEAIAEQVKEVVAEVLSSEYAVVNEFGYTTQSRTSLREQIAKEVTGWAGKSSSSDYGRKAPTNLDKFIAEQVDRQMKADLVEVVAANRQVLKEHMRSAAARLLADEAAKK